MNILIAIGSSASNGDFLPSVCNPQKHKYFVSKEIPSNCFHTCHNYLNHWFTEGSCDWK